VNEEIASMANFLVANNDDAGIGSLRQAIMDANVAPGLDTIVFDTAGLFATPQTIALLAELPAITDSVDISGTGSAMLTIQRDPGAAVNFRIFDVENAAATTPISVIISGLTLSGGLTSVGGAISSVGENLSLDGVVVSGNVADINAGGIYFAGGNGSTLSITHSSIIGNSAGTFGGGLYIDFATSVLLGDDTISGNTALFGSAMYLAQGSITATLNVSTGSATIAGIDAIFGPGALAKAGAGMLVLADSNQYVGGTALEAGTLDLAALQAAGPGIITFASGSQTLRIENAALSGNAFTNTIDSFGTGDAIDLAGLVFAPGATVTYNTSSHLLAVTSNGITDMLTLTNPASTHFIAASDGAGGTKVLLGPAGSVLHDFNADGNSDVLWRQDGSGQIYLWEMNGLQIKEEGSPPHAPVTNDWHVQGVGDFDGDFSSDFLWRQDGSGQVYVWEMNGLQVTAEGAVEHAPVTTDWHVQGVGDFNGDGKSDVLWRQDGSGQVYVWEMNGQQVQAEGAVAHAFVTDDWHVQGIGDFNGDGNSDVLWRQDGSGQVYVWEMNGQQVQAEGAVAHAPVTTDWHVQGIGDFNGDGNSDVLWRQDGSDQVYVWEMNGQQVHAEGAVAHAPVTSDWHVESVNDFNGDGNSDVLWRQDGSGQVYVWEMTGQQVQAEGAVAHAPVTSDWQIFSDQNFII
jgi:autotransporter-associated beta strand protein